MGLTELENKCEDMLSWFQKSRECDEQTDGRNHDNIYRCDARQKLAM